MAELPICNRMMGRSTPPAGSIQIAADGARARAALLPEPSRPLRLLIRIARIHRL